MKQSLLELFETESPVAFVTGSAADRVGRRIAERFLSAGFRVAFHSRLGDGGAVHYINSLTQRGQTVQLCVGSVESPESAPRWLDQILSAWNRVDVLVNSAAIWDPMPLEQITASELRRNFEINAMGSFLTSQAFGLQMVKQTSGGAIVQIGDWACQRPYADFAAYFLGKAPIETMTRSFAVELASRNPRVRVNAILPGPVMLASEISQATEARIVAQSLLKRAGRPEDVAEAAFFLANSPFITGVSLPVDGGRTIYNGLSVDHLANPQTTSPN